jgi:hypothetical protein
MEAYAIAYGRGRRDAFERAAEYFDEQASNDAFNYHSAMEGGWADQGDLTRMIGYVKTNLAAREAMLALAAGNEPGE